MDPLSWALLGVLAFVGTIFLLIQWGDQVAAREKREKHEKYLQTLSSDQFTVHYCMVDNRPGVTRETVLKLAERLGVNENEVIHQALYDLAAKFSLFNKES